jgi:hypothetical protein
MPLMRKKTPEERAKEAEQKEQQRQADEERKAVERVEKARQAFYNTPGGQARLAFQRGDHLFQCAIDVMSPGGDHRGDGRQ